MGKLPFSLQIFWEIILSLTCPIHKKDLIAGDGPRNTRKSSKKNLVPFGDAVAQGFRVRRRRFRVFSGQKMMEPGTPQRIV